MKESQAKMNESDCSASDSTVGTEEKTLILVPVETKKNIDETISSPGRYVSRYHYNSKNIDKYLEFCPHCKKPTMSAFHRTVIDNALDYLEGRRVLIHYPNDQSRFLKYSTALLIGRRRCVLSAAPINIPRPSIGCISSSPKRKKI